MKIIIEEVDGAYYSDLILSPEELKRLKRNETVDAQAIYKRRKIYVGVRLQGIWDYNEDDEEIQE